MLLFCCLIQQSIKAGFTPKKRTFAREDAASRSGVFCSSLSKNAQTRMYWSENAFRFVCCSNGVRIMITAQLLKLREMSLNQSWTADQTMGEEPCVREGAAGGEWRSGGSVSFSLKIP